ncbi:histone lysine methyltransferase Set9, variant 2 [Basidiobolus ranarum]|uniref:Histone-lysine N-methyltransferase SET9 n=2 Tax=Basidiobolus ranarum TaxID=34480 RepID=A0ABR2WSH2_9FUNG
MKLETLAKYDDLLSDVLVDSLYLWFQTHKMNQSRRSARVKVEEVVIIVQENVVAKRSINSATERLLSLDYIKTFLRKKNAEDTQGFIDHSKRYLSIYHPEAGFEISQTHRYRTRKAEASVVATKRWEVGEEIRCCSGGVALLSEKELHHLEQKKMDFSVMWSSRKSSYCLFLGPARFVNHDCNSNCEFEPFGPDGICLKVVKPIEVGEEISTYYGGNYFGNKNCECQCATCERVGEGAFRPTIESILEENEHERNRRRSLRKRSGNVSYTSDSTSKSTIEHRYDGQQAMRDKYGILFDILKNKGDPLDSIQERGILDSIKPSQSINLDNSAALSAISNLLRQVDKSMDTNPSNDKTSHHKDSMANPNSKSIGSLSSSRILKIIKTCTIVCSVCSYIWVDDALFSDDPTIICMRELKGIQAKDMCPRCERHEKIFGNKWPVRVLELSYLESEPVLLGLADPFAEKSYECAKEKSVVAFEVTKKAVSKPAAKTKRRRLAKIRPDQVVNLPSKKTKKRVITSIRSRRDTASSFNLIQDLQVSQAITSQVVNLTQILDEANYADSSSELSEVPTSELNSVSDISESHTPVDVNDEGSLMIYETPSSGTLTLESERDEVLGKSLQIIKRNPPLNGPHFLEPTTILASRVKKGSFGAPVPEFTKTMAVFVNPLDDNEPFWWPALLIPSSETDRSMRRPKPGQYAVRYFEDGTYSLCWPDEFVVFDSTTAPFTQFKNLHPDFLHHIAVRRALAYLETDQVLNEIKWARWQHNDNRPVSQRRHEGKYFGSQKRNSVIDSPQ